MRREPTDARPLADAPDHAHQCLIARGLLWILAPPLPLVRRDPLLDFDGEHVVVELRLQLAEARAELVDDVRGEWEPVPVLALPVHASAASNEVEVCPPAADRL